MRNRNLFAARRRRCRIIKLFLLQFIVFWGIVVLLLSQITREKWILETDPERKPPGRSVPPPPNAGIVLRTREGLGNQLFLYACHYAMAKALGWQFYFLGHDLRGSSDPWKIFALNKFQVPLISPPDVANFVSLVNFKGSGEDFLYKIRPKEPQYLGLSYDYYCQSKDYFKDYEDEIRSIFKLRSKVLRGVREEHKEMLAKIERSNSVAVHVRRGDHLTLKEIYNIPIRFQLLAMDRMATLLREPPTFFIFTDEIDSLKQDLNSTYHEVVLVSEADVKKDPERVQENSIAEFYMMSRCKHQIVPDSAFSWWAAYLNENKEKIVISSGMGPTFMSSLKGRSAFIREEFGKRYLPDGWIFLNPYISISKLNGINT